MAERVGFEPTVPQRGTTVFETAAFDRSAISPCGIKFVEGMSIAKPFMDNAELARNPNWCCAI